MKWVAADCLLVMTFSVLACYFGLMVFVCDGAFSFGLIGVGSLCIVELARRMRRLEADRGR